jgi:heme/copper-type cytochrome/quinol oxidase subunit 2
VAQQVQIAGASSTAKIRNPITVAILGLITLGIYVIFWWYYANREMVDYGRAKGSDQLGDSPVKSLLAVFPGALIIVPAIWTTFTTFQRVQAAQKLAGVTPINGWLGLVLYLVFSPAYVAYMQSGLNSVWEAQSA